MTPEETIRGVFELAARISTEQDIEQIVRINADFARDLAGADRCTLWLVDEEAGQMWTRVAHGLQPIRIPLGQGLVGECVTQDCVLLVNDAATDARMLRSVDAGSGYRTEQVLCVPLRTDGQVIGALQVLNKASGFTDGDADVMCLLAHFAATAIRGERLRHQAEHARLTLYELSLAREVQARLLPSAPTTKGLQCLGVCRPAHTIGGDYYDLLVLPDGQFAFTLGDVSGKGIPAAVLMASSHTLLRSLLQRGETLSATIADLNVAIYQTSSADRYSTLFCGMISADRTTLTYVNAGDVEPFLLHADGTRSRLAGSSVPVGLLQHATYEQYTAALLPGDTLVVVSDGVVESSNAAGDFWDDANLEQQLALTAAAPLATLCDELYKAADAFAAGADQYDDMTVVAVRML